MCCGKPGHQYTHPPASANFVGIVVGFLNVLQIRLRSLLLAASLSFEIKIADKLLVTGFTATHGGHCCRCFLPDLTGLTSLRCAGPGHTIYKLEIYKTAFN